MIRMGRWCTMRPIVRPAAEADPKALLKERKKGGLVWCKDFMRVFLLKKSVLHTRLSGKGLDSQLPCYAHHQPPHTHFA